MEFSTGKGGLRGYTYVMPGLNVDLVVSAALGALGVKLLDFVSARLIRRFDQKESARALLRKHLDPILKAADELVGKLRSLAETDFADFRHPPSKSQREVAAIRRHAALYLFAQFWARVQLLRMESASVALGSPRAGDQLLNFLYTLESLRIRVLDRAWQRATGEASITRIDGTPRPLTLEEFVKLSETEPSYQRWIIPLSKILDKTNKAENRQRLLLYGVVLHALTNTLDPKHVVTRRRRPWSHKLSDASRNELEKGVFHTNLSFVKRPTQYTRAEKKAARRAVPTRSTTSPLGLV